MGTIAWVVSSAPEISLLLVVALGTIVGWNWYLLLRPRSLAISLKEQASKRGADR